MATDGEDPPACDRDIYEHGETVLVTDSISSNRMERWVRKVAELSGQRVDWHFVGGRACVAALGDISKVMEVIEQIRPELDTLREESMAAMRNEYAEKRTKELAKLERQKEIEKTWNALSVDANLL